MENPTHFTILGMETSLQLASLILYCGVIPLCAGFLFQRGRMFAIALCIVIALHSTLREQVNAAYATDICLQKANELIRQHVEVMSNLPCTAFAFSGDIFVKLLALMIPGFLVGAVLERWVLKNPNRAANI